MSECSGESIRSPLRKPKFETSNLGESKHTFVVNANDCQTKGSYETACDKRVAQLKRMFRLVVEAAELCKFSPLLSCCFRWLPCLANLKMFTKHLARTLFRHRWSQWEEQENSMFLQWLGRVFLQFFNCVVSSTWFRGSWYGHNLPCVQLKIVCVLSRASEIFAQN